MDRDSGHLPASMVPQGPGDRIDVSKRTVDPVTVVSLAGELDAHTAPLPTSRSPTSCPPSPSRSIHVSAARRAPGAGSPCNRAKYSICSDTRMPAYSPRSSGR
jgi:hypothetical protein